MVEEGILTSVNEPTDWVSSMVTVVKPTDSSSRNTSCCRFFCKNYKHGFSEIGLFDKGFVPLKSLFCCATSLQSPVIVLDYNVPIGCHFYAIFVLQAHILLYTIFHVTLHPYYYLKMPKF